MELHSKTPSLPSLISAPAHQRFTTTMLGYGKIKPCHSHNCSFIKAVLEAPTEKKKKVLHNQITREGEAALMRRIGSVEEQRGRPWKEEEEEEEEMGMEDGEAESTWEHRVWVATGHAAIAGVMVKAMEAYTGTTEECLGMIAAAVGGYIVADFATGLYHWGVDNYGNAHTPLVGPHIDAFQGHHKRPWVISTGQFANNIHRQARPAAFFLAPFLLLPSHPFFHTFLAVLAACVVYSQQFHSWVHAKPKDVPRIVVALQNMGLLLPRKMHTTHHRPPYNINYCIVSGLCNPLLDHLNFFGTLEKLIFSMFQARPRSWSKTSIDWLQTGSYFADGTDMDDMSTP